MAERRRPPRPAPDPVAAARWRSYARYIARIAGIEPPRRPVSDDELRRAARDVRDLPGLGEPMRRVLEALDAADAGEPYRPYSRSKG